MNVMIIGIIVDVLVITGVICKLTLGKPNAAENAGIALAAGVIFCCNLVPVIIIIISGIICLSVDKIPAFKKKFRIVAAILLIAVFIISYPSKTESTSYVSLEQHSVYRGVTAVEMEGERIVGFSYPEDGEERYIQIPATARCQVVENQAMPSTVVYVRVADVKDIDNCNSWISILITKGVEERTITESYIITEME